MRVQNSVRRLPRFWFFNGYFEFIQWPGNFQDAVRSRRSGLVVLGFSRACRFDGQVRVLTEAERSIDQRQLVPAVQFQVIQKNAVILQTEGAGTGGPARNSGVRRAV